MRFTFPLAAALLASCQPAAAPKPAPAPAPVAGPNTASARPGMPGDTTPRTPAAGAPAAGAPGGAGGAPGAPPEPSPRPYATVVRGDVKTKAGLFKTHRIGSRVLYEIPRAELGKDLLLVTQIAKTTIGAGYGGQALGNRVVRWELKNNRVLFKSISYNIRADSTDAIYRAVESANYNTILAAFNVEAFGPDSAPVIDVSRLYTNPPVELNVTNRYRGNIDPARSFLERVATYPTNIEVEATLTVNSPPAMPGAPAASPFGAPALPPSASFLVHWSMLKLPETPMMPRLMDDRVGYFSTSTTDFSRPEQRAATRTFITRYRLECSDRREGALCYPKKPITYYVDPATPQWLQPWVKKAIESWKPAFEAAGFKDGIVAKDAPTKAEDPDWAAEDARYSVIMWLPSSIENAVGPHVHDPRSGEIMEADLQIYHNVMNLNTDWYWTQVGALDARAKKLPFPDSLAGRLMQFVIAHEIGHSLGFQHNMKASAMYPADSIRNKDFVHRMGHTPTLMDYSRFNYVAQPEDGIALEDLIPRIGPYDIWATHWGYAPIPGANTPDDERPTLDAWAREQDAKPWLRFSTADDQGADPYNNTEAVGDADAVKSTALGIKNLKRLVPMVLPATTDPLKNDDLTDEIYNALVGQWQTELRHVAVIVGSAETQDKYGSQPGPRFTPMNPARQRAAVKFLNENAFATPHFLLDPAILRRLEPEGSIQRINGAQRSILAGLLSDIRLSRLVSFEADAKPGEAVYPASELLADVRGGVWSELQGGSVKIDAYRRALQNSYLELARAKVNPTAPNLAGLPPGIPASFLAQLFRRSADGKALFRAELKTLDGQIAAAQPRAGDAITKAHLAQARHEIDDILNPKK
ncbi:MAG: zinc-dependent metalloprotease [Gemmatimonadetes bacterium]|nr:zinc-dependent metalloprotease [Gemmatimonadota bacterium]